jgi:hypothetical protein
MASINDGGRTVDREADCARTQGIVKRAWGIIDRGGGRIVLKECSYPEMEMEDPRTHHNDSRRRGNNNNTVGNIREAVREQVTTFPRRNYHHRPEGQDSVLFVQGCRVRRQI